MRCRPQPLRLPAALALVSALTLADQHVAGAAPATPTLRPQASMSGFPAGVGLYDTVTLGNGANPTGTLTFSLYPPEDPTCSGAPIFVSTKNVTGNGYYQSDSVASNQAGTYRWKAAYGGDANNAPAVAPCNDTTQAVTTAKRSPTFSATASKLGTGGRLSDTATLGMGIGPAGPTGTITFRLYGRDNLVCSGSPVFTSVKTVTANGAYTSDAFRPTAAGTYRWTAYYSGDANNNSATTICADPAQAAIVPKPTLGDFDGDRKADVGIWRSSTGAWYVENSPGVSWGLPEDIPVPGDYDGNGATDAAVYRPAQGGWYIHGPTPRGFVWGASGDIPVPGDYDGNGTTDAAVYRPAQGAWYILDSRPRAISWGTSGDIPVPGDYDGNGTTDAAVYRPAQGGWYINGPTPRALAWGTSGDIPVPGDYDGNGTTDAAVYRPAQGAWYINDRSPRAVSLGTAGDIPVPADYDGDGKTDVAVYRPSTGSWYVNTPSPRSVSWGASTDVPVQLPSAIRRSFF